MDSFQFAAGVIASIITMSSALLTVNPSILKNLGVSDEAKTKRVTVLLLITICLGFLFNVILIGDVQETNNDANGLTLLIFFLTLVSFFIVILIFAFVNRTGKTVAFIGRLSSIEQNTNVEWSDLLLSLELNKNSTNSFFEYEDKNKSTDKIKLTLKVFELEKEKKFTYESRDSSPPIVHIYIEIVDGSSQNVIKSHLKIVRATDEDVVPITLFRLTEH